MLAAPVVDVWRAITDPAELSSWFGADVEFDLAEGGDAVFRGHDGDRRRGQIIEVDAGRRFAFRWWPVGRPLDATTVVIALIPAGGGTEVVVSEQRVPPPPLAPRVHASLAARA